MMYYPNQTNCFFASVANESIAFNYPVGYGSTGIFKDENEPYIYIKKMGFSQLERPVFEKYRREQLESAEIAPSNTEVDKVTLEELKLKIGALESEIKALKEKGEKDGSE